MLLFLIFLACVAGVERNFLCECNSIRIAHNILRMRHRWKDIYLMTLIHGGFGWEREVIEAAQGREASRKLG